MPLLRHRAHVAGVLAGAMLACGCGAAAFACEQSDDCSGAQAGGVCEADGWCSFPDAACASGRRYGGLAGGGLAGQCVAEDGTSTAAASSSGATDSLGTTVDPTIASLEGSSQTDTRADDESSGEATTGGAVCGDAVIDGVEECDLGPGNGDGSACRADCTLNVCGDGDVGPGEACDGSPGCTSRCQLPGCGDGEITRDEECDDAAPLEVACTDLGWFGGELTCARCRHDVTQCVGCGPDGCSFDPCFPDDVMVVCPLGEHCAPIGEVGTCTADCAIDEDCPADVPSACYLGMGINLCLPTCDDGDCPPGMACVPTMPPVCVFE